MLHIDGFSLLVGLLLRDVVGIEGMRRAMISSTARADTVDVVPSGFEVNTSRGRVMSDSGPPEFCRGYCPVGAVEV